MMKVLVAQSYLTISNPMDCSPPGSSVDGILQARILEWVAIPFSGGVFLDQGTEPKSPALESGFFITSDTYHVYACESCSVVSDSLRPHRLCSPWNSPGQNAGEGSLSLLQRIFTTQRSNPGLLHCRQILY